jgi:hypothetical protein
MRGTGPHSRCPHWFAQWLVWKEEQRQRQSLRSAHTYRLLNERRQFGALLPRRSFGAGRVSPAPPQLCRRRQRPISMRKRRPTGSQSGAGARSLA